MNILAKSMRFGGEFGFYTWSCFIVNKKLISETQALRPLYLCYHKNKDDDSILFIWNDEDNKCDKACEVFAAMQRALKAIH